MRKFQNVTIVLILALLVFTSFMLRSAYRREEFKKCVTYSDYTDGAIDGCAIKYGQPMVSLNSN